MAGEEPYWSSVDEVLADLGWGYFPERSGVVRDTLLAMESMADDPDAAIGRAGECLGPIHAHYSAQTNAELLKRFPEVQKALFGLELDPIRGRRYREHFLHMFNVWVLGARVLGQLIRSSDDAFKALKIQPEPPGGPFPQPYTKEKRLWFVWMLMSTFHDVGIPVQHLEEIHKGLNTYLDFFELDLHPFAVEDEPAAAVALDYYFSLMARMYSSGVQFDPEDQGYYRWADRPSSYFWRALIEAFSKRDHGVVASIRLFRSVEVLWMRDLHEDPRYHLTTVEKWDAYVNGVLEQDITRAAVGIALHSLSEQAYPRLFPVSFGSLPMTFLLMLCDELQEFFRLEGITLKGVIPLKRLPVVKASFTSAGRIDITFTAYYEEPKEKEEIQAILEDARQYAKSRDEDPTLFQDVKSVVSDRWSKTSAKLCRRLGLGPDENIRVIVDVRFKPRRGGIASLHDFDSDRDC